MFDVRSFMFDVKPIRLRQLALTPGAGEFIFRLVILLPPRSVYRELKIE